MIGQPECNCIVCEDQYEAGCRARTREIVDRLWELVETNGKAGQHEKEIAFRDFARELEHEYLTNTESPS